MVMADNKLIEFNLLWNEDIFIAKLSTRADPAPSGRTLYIYQIEVTNYYEEDKYYPKVRISDVAAARINRTEGNIICAKLIYDSIKSSQLEYDIVDGNIDILKDGENIKGIEIRKLLLDYISMRYELFPNLEIKFIELLAIISVPLKKILKVIYDLIEQNLLKLEYSKNIMELIQMEYEDVFNILNKPIGFNKDLLPRRMELNPLISPAIYHNKIIEHKYFKLIDIQSEFDGKFAFLLMPFNENEYPQEIYDIYKKVVKNVLDINCVRVDGDYLKQYIENKIYSHIVKSELIIADLSTGNKNVVFELGIAMAISKIVIPCFNYRYKTSLNKLSFDYEHFDTIFFDNYSELEEKLNLTLLPLKRMLNI